MKIFSSVKSGLAAIILAASYIVCGCSKSDPDTSGLYVPSPSDATVNATLTELQQGRSLFINNCNSCHALPSPDSYTVTEWKSILTSMTPRTALTQPEITLVTKYVCRGKQ
jgi:hypothetical protein